MSLKKQMDIAIGEVILTAEVSYDEGKELKTTVTFNKDDWNSALREKDNNLMRTLSCGLDPKYLGAVKKEAKKEGPDAEAYVEYVIKLLVRSSADLSDKILSGAFNFKDGEEKDYVMNLSLKDNKATYKFGRETLMVVPFGGQEEAMKAYVEALASSL